jgi:hypothetical protein
MQKIESMNKLILILAMAIFNRDVKSQIDFKVYHEITVQEMDRVFQMGHILIPGLNIMNDGKGKLYYEKNGITKDAMKKTKPVNMIIRVSDLKGRKVKDMVVDFNDIDIDLSGFGLTYLGNRKFLIIDVGRYSFLILNLTNDKLIGPLKPSVEGKRGDTQDGSLSINVVFNEGQYLIGYSYGMGLFCYNLMDLYNPIQIESFYMEKSNISGNYFFLDKRKDNTYNGIFAEMPRINTVDSVHFLFQGIKFETDSNKIITRRIVDNRYLILSEKNETGDNSPIIIDYKIGKVINSEDSEKMLNELKSRN